MQNAQTKMICSSWKRGHAPTKRATMISAVNQTAYERLDGSVATAGGGHKVNRSESLKVVVVGKPNPQTKSSPHVKTDVDKTFLSEVLLRKKKEQNKTG